MYLCAAYGSVFDSRSCFLIDPLTRFCHALLKLLTSKTAFE